MADTELQDLPGYREAHAEYAATVAVAANAEDELGKLRAENAWLKTEQDFRQKLAISREAATKLSLVKDQIAKDYPDVPEVIYEHISDPDALLKVAQEFDKKFKKGQEGNWGKPSGAPSGDASGNAKSSREMEELVKRVNTGDRNALAEYQHLQFTNKVRPYGERHGSITPLGQKSR